MEEAIFKYALLGLLLLFFVVRAPYAWKSRARKTGVDKRTPFDRLLVFLNVLGMAVFPLVYVLTPWLDALAFSLPAPLRIGGAALYLASLVLMYLVLRELGGNWSMQLEMKHDHRLITSGPFGYVRHPMYTAFSLMMAGQLLLTANWLVGLFGVAAWTLQCIVRIPKEEEMLCGYFGSDYTEYREKTGCLLPRLRR